MLKDLVLNFILIPNRLRCILYRYESDQQQAYWNQLLSHKSILETDFLPQVKFEDCFQVSDEKILSAVYVSIESKVSIHNKSTWRTAMEFLNETMLKFEAFYDSI